MDDEEFDDCEVYYEVEPLTPVPFSVWSVGVHFFTALSGVASVVDEFFGGIARECGHAANHRLTRWKAKDEGEKFATDVLKSIGGLDKQG